MLLNIAIVEDQPEEAALLKQHCLRYGQETGTGFTFDHFRGAEAFLSKYRPVYDIVFMDICLPRSDGLKAAAQLRKMDTAVVLIFVTNMANMAIRGYEVDAFDFIVKPVTYANFCLKMPRILNRLEGQENRELLITSGNQNLRLQVRQIRYVEISGHDLIYHTVQGDIPSYGNLKKVEEELGSKYFVRCNNCYLVNLHYVRSITGYTVQVGEDRLQISRPRKNEFLQAVNDFLGGTIT